MAFSQYNMGNEEDLVIYVILGNCKSYSHFSAKKISVYATFNDKSFNGFLK